ncbi:hypothetical protein COLO4_26425 [Corchorus olitorius]|uniref:TF-B3 domain-containing protein n=1 Tax=Corchorus olitorius TaxID=93759 RepID=A0A1R3HX89_9ROSI|nr:hypothetical protein COLO4_26425 [Corchorus olitorius]
MRIIIDSSESEDGGEDSPAPPHEASSDVSLAREEFNYYYHSKKFLRKAADSDTLGKGENSVPDDETGTEPKHSRPHRRQPRGGGSVSLEVIMHATHVQRRFQLGLRSYWVEKYIPPHTREVILRVEGKESLIQVYRYRNKQNIETGLSSGWKDFVHKNGLKLKDICVFTPAGKTEKGHLILDVAIHRCQEVMDQTPTANIALTPD